MFPQRCRNQRLSTQKSNSNNFCLMTNESQRFAQSWNTKERPSLEVIVISNNLVALVSYESPGWSNYPLEP